MVILVNGDRFETMACAMAWAKRLGVNVEVRSDEWLERLQFEYVVDCGETDLEINNDGCLCEIDGVVYSTPRDAQKALARTRKYRPLGLYEVEA